MRIFIHRAFVTSNSPPMGIPTLICPPVRQNQHRILNVVQDPIFSCPVWPVCNVCESAQHVLKNTSYHNIGVFMYLYLFLLCRNLTKSDKEKKKIYPQQQNRKVKITYKDIVCTLTSSHGWSGSIHWTIQIIMDNQNLHNLANIVQ